MKFPCINQKEIYVWVLMPFFDEREHWLIAPERTRTIFAFPHSSASKDASVEL